MKKFWKREPTNEKTDNPSAGQTLKMITLRGESFFPGTESYMRVT